VAELHLVAGVAVMVLNLAAAIWGAVAWATNRASVSFWYVLRGAQASIVVQVVLGAVLLAAGREATDGWHYMYGTAPLVVNLFAEGMRIGAAQREVPDDIEFDALPAGDQRAIALRIVRREMGIMTLACLLIVAFAVRAAQVSGEMF
jgi:hypothetical protein